MIIYWKNGSHTLARALIDTGAKASLIYGNPQKCKDRPMPITGIGGAKITAKQVTLTMKIGQFPKREYSVVIVPIKEYIIGIDILRGMSLNLEDGKC